MRAAAPSSEGNQSLTRRWVKVRSMDTCECCETRLCMDVVVLCSVTGCQMSQCVSNAAVMRNLREEVATVSQSEGSPTLYMYLCIESQRSFNSSVCPSACQILLLNPTIRLLREPEVTSYPSRNIVRLHFPCMERSESSWLPSFPYGYWRRLINLDHVLSLRSWHARSIITS